MSDHDAFEEEMLFRSLSDRDVERLLDGQGPEEGRLAEVADFAQAVRETLPVTPPRDEAIVRRLAATARTARLEAEVTATTRVRRDRRRERSLHPRLAMLVRVTAVLAAVPMLFAALSFADVTLPKPARDAFAAVGVDLPNQPADDQAATETGSGSAGESQNASPAGAPKSERVPGLAEPTEQHGQGIAKDNPARSGGRANGEQGRGRALGKRGLAPGQLQPPGQLRAPGRQKPPVTGKPSEKAEPAPSGQGSKAAAPGRAKAADQTAANAKGGKP